MRVERAQINLVSHNRDTAIHVPAAGTNIVRKLALVQPDRASGAGVEGKGTIVLGSTVKDSIHHQRSSFELARGCCLIDPLPDQRLRVRLVVLIEWTEAAAGAMPQACHPVLEFLKRR